MEEEFFDPPQKMYENQRALITSTFKIADVREFRHKVERAVQVTTWDGKEQLWMTKDQVERMAKEVCILGPMAAMFGREFQQTLMSPNPPKLISIEDFQFSVDAGRASLRQQEEGRAEYADNRRDDDQVSQASKRTRSPRKPLYSDIRSRQAPDLRPNSAYPRDTEFDSEGRPYSPPETRRR